MSQSVARALQILGELGEGPRSLDELAARLEVHKSTVLRLLRTLEHDRFVRHDEQHRYSLGSRLFDLGAVALEHHAVRDLALPHLTSLGRTTGGQAVHLAALEGHDAVYLAKVESTSPVRMYSRVGLPAPVHATAVGKVLLADLPARRLDAVLAGLDLAPFTSRTITDAGAFRAELDLVRERGWAEDAMEHEEFVNCIGAPVHDPGGRVVAAVSVSVPTVLLERDGVHDLLPHLLQTTSAIEAAWSGKEPS
ncbi:IclR family transcriptional regulator [Nocardioides mangrovicus]|uniref:IclR family transcriptional regulator n=1 Tax=Nocardioides mangrovicus TaxID=2478913 RepID=A0A3L8P353_9ACTN|nr:IclR family transcriptional regulator [Nocardioides mangrovicus]RLV49856.1 IclR family transcriptional regulator [Nocardioides mangrovicus]